MRSVTRVRGGRMVLHGVTLRFAPAQLTAVVGPSGAGKTTLLEVLAGLALPDGGEVRFDDRPLGRPSAEELAAWRRARVGYLPQEPTPVGFLSATENVSLALIARGTPRDVATGRARAALHRLGLAERREQRLERLSAGEAQRTALARALACADGLLIADEPTSRLDEETAGIVAATLADAAHADGQTVICATRDPQVIARADEVIDLSGPTAGRDQPSRSIPRAATGADWTIDDVV
ncbi:MAG: ATP-binding cassette domain-containing protein [Solirubrobacterales bacterium]|nr:ATP-binding cassette domain-containing protein [Solirubrobacterales bacterium]